MRKEAVSCTAVSFWFPTRPLILCVTLVAVSLGCKKSEETAAQPAVAENAPPEAPAVTPRAGEREDARPRDALFVVYDDPEDDPELVDDYYAEAENDGGVATEASTPPALGDFPGNRSFSVGPANSGWLINGKALAFRGPHHRVLKRTVTRGYYFGSDDLTRLIQKAAAHVANKHPGAVLRVGNLSKEGGGKIGPSVSHQSGRDADIGLYATNLDGEFVDAPGFPNFGADRLDRTRRYLFDVARNWAFVEALLSDERARIQWIFLDDPLKEMLIDFGIRAGASAAVIDQAERVIVRPKDSSPHADHFHIRIFCNTGDQEFGCTDYGPEWQWVKAERAMEEELLNARVDRIMKGLEGIEFDEAGNPEYVKHDQDDDDNDDDEDDDEPDEPPALPTKNGVNSPDELRDPPTHIDIDL